MEAIDLQIVHSNQEQQFEADLGGQFAVAQYHLAPGRIMFTHTEVPPQFRGRGIAGQVVRAGLEYAREQGLEVVPLCPYVAAYMGRHPEYQSLLARR